MINMGITKKIINVIFVLLSLLTVSVYSTSTNTECSTSERWSSIKKKCVPCSQCPPGHYRNLTESYTGSEVRDERCPRCRPCPDGRYSESGLGECNKCRVNCTEMKREYDEFCSKVHDAKCGSCLYGYEDTFRHTLFPCSPKKALRLIKTPKDPSLQLNNPELPIEDEQKHSVPIDTHNGADNSRGFSTEMMIILGLVAFVLIGSVSVAFLIKRKRNRTEQNGASDPQGSYRRVNMESFTHDTDIEVDAAHADETCVLPRSVHRADDTCVLPRSVHRADDTSVLPRSVHRADDTCVLPRSVHRADDTNVLPRSVHRADDTNVLPRSAHRADDTSVLLGSMPYGDASVCWGPKITNQLGARPEIQLPTSTQHCNGIFYVQLSDVNGGPYIRQYERKQDICKCRDETPCHCSSYNFPNHEMEKLDECITVVASEICHNPFPLFRALGLKDPIIYQEDNSRERDPVNISQKELVINLLNRWIEVKSTPTTVRHLSVALCKADFHHINDKLYNKYNNIKTYL